MYSWEPYTSFEGSEHIIEGFWARIGGSRDHTRMDLFEVDEEVFPVGPPGSESGTPLAFSGNVF